MDLAGLSYLTDFACLGSDCPDHCCQSWTVFVDAENYARLRGKMSSPEERAEFEAKVQKIEGKTPENRVALMVLREDKTCSFLDEQRMCTVHARYGEALLSNICAIYPRTPTRIGDRIEVMATPSCPEVARRILAAADASELVPLEPHVTGRRVLFGQMDPGKSKDPYERNFVPIRGLVDLLLANEAYPATSRLFFLAWFADKARDLLVRGQKQFDGEALQELGSSLEDPATLASLENLFGRALVDPRFGLSVVRGILGIPPRLMPARLVELVAELEAGLATVGVSLQSDPDELKRALPGLPPLSAAAAARLDVLVGRYARHEVVRRAFVKEATFIGFVHRLLLRAATFRFLVATLARLRGLATADQIDDLATRAVYLLTRALEHNAVLMKETLRALEEHGLLLQNAVSLIRVAT